MTANFADEANWLSLYDNLTIGATGIPIAPIFLTSSLSYRFLRVTANNQNAKDTWKYGGTLEFLVNEAFAAVVVDSSGLLCNRPIIIKAPEFIDTYQLRVSIPRWFDEISLQVDGYTGVL